MEEIKCFDYTLYKSQCDSSVYEDNDLLLAIDELLSSEHAKRTDPSERQGTALSTVGSEFNVLHMSQTHNLISWIISQIMTIEEYKSKNSNAFDFTRHWANRIFKDCSGLCHTHPSNADGVAIFYLNVPDNGSELVIIDKGNEHSKYLDYTTEQRHHINVNSGTLIIHKPNVPHAVSIHNSEDPRTCLIFEFIIAEETYEN